MAKKLVDAAKAAGADAVKFQTFKAEHIVTGAADMAEYQKKNIGKTESQFAMLKKLELPYNDFAHLKSYCDKQGIMFLSTPHTPDAVDVLLPLVPAFKVGSGDLTNIPFLEQLAKTKKPIILSTGMGTLQEVKEGVAAIEKQGNKNIILLHCTSNYPCPPEEVNMRAMETLQQTFPYPVGYSDHTDALTLSIMARTLGAVLLEKHFTLDRSMTGPDHKASLSPTELKEMIASIRYVERAFGNGEKQPHASEKRIAAVARKSVVTVTTIAKGEVIDAGKLAIKRPGTGLAPKLLSAIIGKRAKRNIAKDTLLSRKDYI